MKDTEELLGYRQNANALTKVKRGLMRKINRVPEGEQVEDKPVGEW